MAYLPAPYELEIIKQHTKDVYIRVELLNDRYEILDRFEGDLISGNYNNDSESNSRRTFNCQMYLKDNSLLVGRDKKIWLDRYIRVYYGIKPVDTKRNITRTQRLISIAQNKLNKATDENVRLQLNAELQENQRMLGQYQDIGECKWWLTGTFAFTQASYSYSESDNTLSLSCSDLMCLYDGTIDGQIKMDTYIIFSDTVAFNDSTTANLSYFLGLNKYSVYDVEINGTTYSKISANCVEETNASNVPVKQTWTLSFGDYTLKSVYDLNNLYSSTANTSVLVSNTSVTETNELKVYINTETNYEDVNKYQASTGYTFTIFAGQPIRSTIVALCKAAGIKNYIIAQYDENHDIIPHDLVYSDAVTWYDVWKDICALYSGYEFFFDENGTFIWKKTPTGDSGQENEIVVLNNEVIDPLVISENTDNSFQGIYNITEVWGKSLEITNEDRYASTSSYDSSTNTYSITLKMIIKDGIATEDRGQISSYLTNLDRVAFLCANENTSDAPKLLITANVYDGSDNNLGTYVLPAMNIIADDGSALAAGRMQPGNLYVLTYRNAYINTTTTPTSEWQDCMYFNGQAQCFGRYVETDPNIAFSTVNTRPLVRRVNYDNLYSDDLCVNQAEYLTYQSCQMMDTINLTMIIIPWLNTNEKVQYLMQSVDNREQLLSTQNNPNNDIPKYIIKNISWNITDGTMSLQLYRWYPTLKSVRYS